MTILIELWIFFCSHKVKSNYFKSAADRAFSLDLLGFPGFCLLAAGGRSPAFRPAGAGFGGMSRLPALLVAGRWVTGLRGRWSLVVQSLGSQSLVPVARLPVALPVRLGGARVAHAAMLSAGSGTGWKCCHVIGWEGWRRGGCCFPGVEAWGSHRVKIRPVRLLLDCIMLRVSVIVRTC